MIQLFIERLYIRDGKATFSDAASGTQIALEKLEFRGELRSLTGPIKGEGSFVVAGKQVPYRISASRVDEDGGTKLRLALDPIDRPRASRPISRISLDHGTPRFRGQSAIRPSGRPCAGGRAVSDHRALAAEQPREGRQRSSGPGSRSNSSTVPTSALPSCGERRMSDWARAADQCSAFITADRSRSDAVHIRRDPAATARFGQDGGGGYWPQPPPAHSNAAERNRGLVTLGGAVLQRLTAELESDGEDFNIRTFDFRAPGMTQAHFAGNWGRVAPGLRSRDRAISNPMIRVPSFLGSQTAATHRRLRRA